MKTKPPGKSSAETLDSPTSRLRPRPSVSTARRVLPARSVRQRTVEARSSAAQESTRRGSQPDPCETSTRERKPTDVPTAKSTRSRKPVVLPPRELHPRRAKAIKTRVIRRQNRPPSSPSTSTSRPGRKAKSTVSKLISAVDPSRSRSHSTSATPQVAQSTKHPSGKLPKCNETSASSRKTKRTALSTGRGTRSRKTRVIRRQNLPPSSLSTSTSRPGRKAKSAASKPISAADPSDKESARRPNLGMEKKKLIAMLSARDDKKRSSIGEARICYCTGSNLEVMTVCEKLDQRGTASLFGEEEDMCICELGRKNRLRRLLFPDDPATSCPNGCEPRALVESEDLFEKSTLTRKIFENGGKLTLLFICRVCCWSSKFFHSEKTIEWAEKKWQNEEGCGAAGIIQCTCGNVCGTPIASIPLDLCDEMANKIKDIDMASAPSVTEETWTP